MSDTSTLAIAAFLLFGLALAGFGGYVWYSQQHEISTFEPTNATVLSSRADTLGDSNELDVTYEYTVDGETYRSSNVYPGAFDLNSNAESVVDDHPEGATVTAYYDPENPADAFLVKKENRLILFLVTAFGVLLTVGSGWLLGARLDLLSG